MSSRSRRVVTFTGPHEVTVVEEALDDPGPQEVRVRTQFSAVSPGTETLLYRNQAPPGALDPTIDALQGDVRYPVRYGYAAVGRVEAVGGDVPHQWKDRRVFAFHPHASAFNASPDTLVPLPDAVSTRDAVFIPNLETAVNLLMDGGPGIGERVVVFGQGVVGLLVTSLLSRYPTSQCLTVEPDGRRRGLSRTRGADRVFDAEALDELRSVLGISRVDAVDAAGGTYEGADLVYELTGRPDVLNDALAVTGFDGRIVVGSWYGTRRAPVDLGARFHRSRIRIVSSQVSTIAPAHRGRWSKERRMQTVLNLLPSVQPSALITEVRDVEDAPSVYAELAGGEGAPLQPVFAYS